MCGAAISQAAGPTMTIVDSFTQEVGHTEHLAFVLATCDLPTDHRPLSSSMGIQVDQVIYTKQD